MFALPLLLSGIVCGSLPLAAQAGTSKAADNHSCTDYYYGVGVPRSAAKAFQCFQNSGPDYIWLILMTLNGEGTPQSVRSARELLAKAKQEPPHDAEVSVLMDDTCCDQGALQMAETNIENSDGISATVGARLNICDFQAAPDNSVCLLDFDTILESKRDAEFAPVEAKLSPSEKASLDQIKAIFDDLETLDRDWEYEEHIQGAGRASFAAIQKMSVEFNFASLRRKVIKDHGLKARSEQEFQARDKELNAVYQDHIRDENGAKTGYSDLVRKAQRVWIKLQDPWNKLCEELYRGEMRVAEIDRAIGTELREIRTQELKEDSTPDFFAADVPEFVHFDLGSKLLDQKDWGGAIREFGEVIRLNPAYGVAYSGMGVAMESKKDWDGAIREYREAIRVNPEDVGAHGRLGWALETTGDWDGAIREYREAIRLSPNWAPVHNNLADVLSDKGDYDGAIAEAREALRLDPKLAGAHVNIGNALDAKGNHDGAIAEFREAIRLAPGYATAHNNLGWELQNKSDWNGAAAEYGEAIRLTPEYAQAHRGLGEALEHQGDDKGALEEYRKATELDPNNAKFRSAYEQLLKKSRK